MASRDDFTKTTVDILAKRVGFLCSNPTCRKHTVGPNMVETKATILGVAAHITAAAQGGPRYDSSLSSAERKDIKNGIWLCCNCSTLVDKDPQAYPIALLQKWKSEAESNMTQALIGQASKITPVLSIPFIEADLIWTSGGRYNDGYSKKNKEIYGDKPIMAGSPIVIHWKLDWKFSFLLHNNSSFPAYNIKAKPATETDFSYLSEIPRTNNIPPYGSINLDAKVVQYFEGTYLEADKLLESRIPQQLDGLELEISYQDEARNNHLTVVRIEEGEIVNIKK